MFSSKDYIKKLKNEFSPYEIKIRRLISRELMNASLAEFWQNFEAIFKNNPWEVLEKRASFIRQELDAQMPAIGFARICEDKDKYLITIRNSLSQPVEFLGLESGGIEANASEILEMSDKLEDLFFPAKKSFVLPIQTNDIENNFSAIQFLLPRSMLDLNESLPPSRKFLQLRLLGLNRIIKVPLSVDQHTYTPNALPFRPKELSLKSKIGSIDGENIYIHPGIHTISDDIFVPSGMRLLIGPKTSLLFERNASIVADGSIWAKGTEKHPITLTSAKDQWDGLLIFGSKDISIFDNVVFSNLGGIGKHINSMGIERDGWFMTGGVNVLDSHVHFKSCLFKDSYTEDALNIYSSTFTLSNSVFQNCCSDGFDGDFVDGTIEHCQFINIGGDAIDISGSSVSVNQSLFFDVKDKAISIGEASVASVNDVKIDRANFGIVSKDLSQTNCKNSLIKSTAIAGVSCYQKKNSFGPVN